MKTLPSRRAFLRQAGLAAALPLASRAASTSGRRVRIGIVGGRFGATFQFHEHPQCTVAAVSDLRADRRARLQKTYSCPTAYESLDLLLRDRTVEAVFLATPAPDHVPHVLQALRAGKHVLCAVPAAMTLEECQALIAAVKDSGLIYMMAETSYWQQTTIAARQFHQEGKFGRLYHVESMYHHAGLDSLWVEDGQRTWRHGLPPMHYPTHCTAHLIGVTGERLVQVSCQGWGDDDARLRDNVYRNPFWNESAQFLTSRGNTMRVDVWWHGAHKGGERARYYGDRMSLFFADPHGLAATIVRAGKQVEKDSGGFERQLPGLETFAVPMAWKTDALPEPLRHNSGHEGSHTFITHEFIDAIVHQRRPAVDVYEAVAYTAPGIVAHQSALRGGDRLAIPSFDA
ncbi:MAG: Gfo/Idh/MocA family oxidoreductase [Verrucomicrobia bacterium]|nr:Gfo/Idh/MocA family oxidoreductase [Verrucomicrobiota bacterium]